VEMLKIPPAWKEYHFHLSLSKVEYLNLGFTAVQIPVSPDNKGINLPGMQTRRKQYGLRHHITGTIHSSMG